MISFEDKIARLMSDGRARTADDIAASTGLDIAKVRGLIRNMRAKGKIWSSQTLNGDRLVTIYRGDQA